jgi:hypothetical protein
VFELEADATIPAEYILLRDSLAESVDNVGAKRAYRKVDESTWPGARRLAVAAVLRVEFVRAREGNALRAGAGGRSMPALKAENGAWRRATRVFGGRPLPRQPPP